MKLLAQLIFAIAAVAGLQTNAKAQPNASPAEIVRGVLSQPDDQLDYGRAKLAFDRIVDPSVNVDATLAEVERLARSAEALAGAGASPAQRLAALRRVIYEAGDWNGGRPFAYDHADPLGRDLRSKLISTYLATRRGNCVSMPILLLIVGERMGLDLALSTAPLHIFLRHRDESGREINLEATSGGHPARSEWYRQNLPMTDRAIESGLYMRTLSRREAVALMASTVVDFLIAEGRYWEATEVGNVILRHYPRDGYTLVKVGTALAELMRTESPAGSSPAAQQRYMLLALENRHAFAAAEALGWTPPR